jgi:hypothetical protein
MALNTQRGHVPLSRHFPYDLRPATSNVSLLVFAPDSVGDGIPDWWRQSYFGSATPSNNQDCATCDFDGTGQNNLFKYVAGLNPTNPASVFVLKINPVAGHAGPEATDLQPDPDWIRPGVHRAIPHQPDGRRRVRDPDDHQRTDDQRDAVSVNDTQATQVDKFYRVDISLP